MTQGEKFDLLVRTESIREVSPELAAGFDAMMEFLEFLVLDKAFLEDIPETK